MPHSGARSLLAEDAMFREPPQEVASSGLAEVELLLDVTDGENGVRKQQVDDFGRSAPGTAKASPVILPEI